MQVSSFEFDIRSILQSRAPAVTEENALFICTA
jgi:hypothetical protein